LSLFEKVHIGLVMAPGLAKLRISSLLENTRAGGMKWERGIDSK
jgi:hypothetical protein